MADTVRLHQLALTRDELLARRYVAIRLDDGRSDNTVYDTRHDAMLAQQYAADGYGYFQIPLETWTARTCDLLLWYYRRAYELGTRVDPKQGLGIFMPSRIEEATKIGRKRRR
jgi:hypothetical protein